METSFKYNRLYKSRHSPNHLFDNCGKDARRKMMKIRVNTSSKSWKWDQYLLESMQWKVGKVSKA